MNKTDWQKELAEYADNEEILQVYEDWGNSGYLQEVFRLLNEFNPDWNKEKELGSWAAEFILDMLEEAEEELEDSTPENREELFREMLEERYEDFRNGHQFARINNVAIQATGDSPENIRENAAAEGEKIGFPVL
ncbi:MULTISPECIES: hypothetical protein [Culturomica]|jgi:hypothetical protein|nr:MULTISPECIES: hypothetical protein [Odoribacteraceae]RHV98339.1 hypothetical protein DXA95_01260 [Odoribacter sp. OF09-27XD]CCZ09731.1 putative uncharacterized protein [Odoribacter sp. CAG:788]HBO25650.1 hypothetical protein [Culturomica sp.]